MSPVGHSLMGCSLGVLCMPARWRRRGKALLLFVFVILANVPDFKYAYRYDVRHSLFVNVPAIAALVAVLAAWPGLRNRLGGWGVIAGGAAAWMSHLLLDSFYSHGGGVPLLWPLSSTRASLAMPWFHTLRGGWDFSAHTARVAAIELAFYGPILGMCVLARRWVGRRRGIAGFAGGPQA